MSDNAEQTSFLGDSMPELNPDAFLEIPAFFINGLTSEQVRHKSQFYRIAYEKSRESVARNTADRTWMKENGLTFGDGI